MPTTHHTPNGDFGGVTNSEIDFILAMDAQMSVFGWLQSPEREVFHGKFDDILDSVKFKLVRTCEILFSADIIHFSYCQQLIDSRNCRNTRANRLLCIVEWKIKENSKHFNVFLEVLTVLELSDLASQLKRNLYDYKRKYKLLVDQHLFLVGAFESRISEVPRELFEKKLIYSRWAELRPDHEMSPVDKAIALAGSVLAFIKEDISKFTILMEYLSESFGIDLNWPTEESSPGSFVPFLTDTVKKMKEDIHSKVSTIQRAKEAQHGLEKRILNVLLSKEEEMQANPESLEAIKVKRLEKELEESQDKLTKLEQEKRELEKENECLSAVEEMPIY